MKSTSTSFIFLTCFLFFIFNADAATKTGSTGSWNTAATWSPAGVPAAGDDVVINGTVTLDINTSCASLTINNGKVFIGGVFTLNISGNFINNGGTFTGSTSTINFNGTGNSLISGTSAITFYNLTVNKSSSAVTITSSSIDKAFAVGNNLSVATGNLILAATDNDYTFSNNVTVATNGILTHSVPWDPGNKKIGIGGNLDVTGIFNPTVRSHVQLNGTGAHSIRTGSNVASTLSILTLNTGNFTANGTLKSNQEAWAMFGLGGSFSTGGYDVTFSSLLINTGTVNVNGGSLTTTNSASIGYSSSAGTMNVSAGTLNVGTDITNGSINTINCTTSPQLNIKGNWINNGTFTAANSSVTFNGIGAGNIGGGNSSAFYNLTINNPLGVTLSRDQTVTNTLTLTSGNLIIGTNNLILGTNATAVAGSPSASNMIVADGGGEVRKNFSGTGSYIFPIGDNTGI
ncbi:MAG: hypothetical protein ABI091_07365, partial [Ferruginibacter sp.]